MTAYSLLMTAGGFVLLFLCGEWLLRGAVGLSQDLGLSPLLIGLTVVATATSMPELVVSLTAGLGGAPDVAVGNIVGSNIANILLILGAAAVIQPITTGLRVVTRDAGAVVAATALFVTLGATGSFGRPAGLLMLALFVFYISFSCWREMRGKSDPAAEAAPAPAADPPKAATAPRPVLLRLAYIGGGGIGLVIGSELLVTGAVDIARALQVSETVIGLTLVAVGTSLPELATAIVAALRRHPDVALGNALGSNIFNLLLVLGALAVTTPVRVAPEVLRFDMWVMAGVTVAIVPVMLSGRRINRVEGAIFLALYAGYVWYQFQGGSPTG